MSVAQHQSVCDPARRNLVIHPRETKGRQNRHNSTKFCWRRMDLDCYRQRQKVDRILHGGGRDSGYAIEFMDGM